ncbi:MAG: hypothetical protein WC860_01640 [Candidatus Margulisiibacteriota bacterium]|jgi:hypothetical protein
MKNRIHDFYIPVMGTSFTIDTPIKIAKFGIDSVIQIMDDNLCEEMKQFYAKKYQLECEKILRNDPDYRARRITSYLNLLKTIVDIKINELKASDFSSNNELTLYFELLNDNSELKKTYLKFLATNNQEEKIKLTAYLKEQIQPGSIDVNIMTKVDRDNYDENHQKLPDIYSDALSALRGFALSNCNSDIVFSAGFNRRLYAYLEKFDDFFPDKNSLLKKKIVLKVSDFRSALIQGKFLAKRGLWVSEYRIESGLNCGGHAFATDGFLLGPILEEFNNNRKIFKEDLFAICNEALKQKKRFVFQNYPDLALTVQGGIGTNNESSFFISYYKVDAVGWGSPFLLVPEATTVDKTTRELLAKAKPEDYYTSNLSPLGIKFNTIHHTESEKLRLKKIKEHKYGYPCTRGHLAFNYDFSAKPLCLASQKYQTSKISELEKLNLPKKELDQKIAKITDKACLCEDLGAGAYLDHEIEYPRSLVPIICPGPNLKYFSGIFSLKEMIGHIYGRNNLLNTNNRPHVFINELNIYFDYLKSEIANNINQMHQKHLDHYQEFKNNLLKGIDYYLQLIPKIYEETEKSRVNFKNDLLNLKIELENYIKQNSNIFNTPICTA